MSKNQPRPTNPSTINVVAKIIRAEVAGVLIEIPVWPDRNINELCHASHSIAVKMLVPFILVPDGHGQGDIFTIEMTGKVTAAPVIKPKPNHKPKPKIFFDWLNANYQSEQLRESYANHCLEMKQCGQSHHTLPEWAYKVWLATTE